MKGIAIPYVIALILGIIVVGVIGYWFFVLGGQGGGAGLETMCRAKAISYCTGWNLNGYDPNKLPDGAEFFNQNPECRNIQKDPFTGSKLEPDSCRKLLGQIKITPSGEGGEQPTGSSNEIVIKQPGG